MELEELSYLVMTAADCAAYNQTHPHPIVSLNQLLEVRAREQPDVTCVGFAARDDQGRFGWDTLTYRALYEQVCLTAHAYSTQKPDPVPIRQSGTEVSDQAVALLAPSCKEFLVNVFALFRLGLSVILLAPQNTPEDIAFLCKEVQASRLIYHERLRPAATAAGQIAGDGKVLLQEIYYDNLDFNGSEKPEACRSELHHDMESDTGCIIFHSSGSSGKPKPIWQKHRVWTKAACCKPAPAAYTTTPLFHGGISDLLRAMMSESTLYMYPSTLPVTSQNLLDSFETLPERAKAFLSVPYILEMLGETEAGIERLRSFDLVSTGGSPLPQETGDRFCAQGVRLVSRYGSSECGFLMTSFRDFTVDKEWSYLRLTSAGQRWLHMADQGDGSYELIVPHEWPTRSKSNRPDGGFATSDLFRKHGQIAGAWLLCGRSDDVLLMVNGEKASPAILEDAFRASFLVQDAVVFGSNRPALGALIVPSAPKNQISQSDLQELLNNVNRLAPAHAQIPPELLVLLKPEDTFPRASKGSLQRSRAYAAYAATIDQAYDSYKSSEVTTSPQQLDLHGERLLQHLGQLVHQAMGLDASESIDTNADLFTQGLNSLQSVRIRNVLQNTLKLRDGIKLPPNIVFECASVARLARYIESLAQETSKARLHDEEELQLMNDMIGRYARIPDSWKTRPSPEFSKTVENLIITGATGSLGAQLLREALRRPDINRVTCLIRARDDRDARKRLLSHLDSQKVDLIRSQLDRVDCHAAALDAVHFGMAPATYQALVESTSLIIHAAWPVHFGLSLTSFETQMKGLRNLLSFTVASSKFHQAKFYFCSSTAAVLGKSPQHVPETLSIDPQDAAPMGYARSKYVAERICASASSSDALRAKVGILRIGQLCGDTRHGVWKPEEGWPLLIASAALAGGLPDLQETISWLPTDKAAAAICDVVLYDRALTPQGPNVFQIVSADSSRTFRDVATALQAAGLNFELVPARAWLEKLQVAREQGSEHPSLKMLDLWQKAYGSSGTSPVPEFETTRAEQFTDELKVPIDDTLVSKMFHYWRSMGLLDPAFV